MVAKVVSFPVTKILIPSTSQPVGATETKPPQHPNTIIDTRDATPITARCGNERVHSDSHSVSDDSTSDQQQKKHHAIISMEEALEIQKKKKGRHHASVTKSLHSLALEYKSHGKFDKAMMYLKDALDILEERVESIVAEIEDENGNEIDDVSRNSHDSKYSIVKASASKATKRYMAHLLEEESVLYACLANIYRKRNMYKEAMDNYLQSINMLVEADHSGDSQRVSMMVRLMKRTEVERTQMSERKGRNQ